MKRRFFGKKLSCLTALALITTMVSTDLAAIPVWANELIAEEAADELLTESSVLADDDILTGVQDGTDEQTPVETGDQEELLDSGADLISEPVALSEGGVEPAVDFTADKLEADTPDADTDDGTAFAADKYTEFSGNEVPEGSDEALSKESLERMFTRYYHQNGVSVYIPKYCVEDGITYTGFNFTFGGAVYIYKNGATLQPKKDYTLSYKDNKNAGTAKLLIKPTGDYTGATVEVPFTINKYNLVYRDGENSWLNFRYNTEKLTIFADGKEHKPDPGLYIESWDNGKRKTVSLKAGKAGGKGDYTIEYPDTDKAGAYKDPGSWTIRVTGMGNFTGEADLKLEIKSKENTGLISKTKIKPSKKTYTYDELVVIDGDNRYFKNPEVTVTDGNRVLDPSQYGAYWYEGTGTGKKTIIVYGTGNATTENPTAYYGATSITVNVTGTSVTSKNTKVVWQEDEYYFDYGSSWVNDFDLYVNDEKVNMGTEWRIQGNIDMPVNSDTAKITVYFDDYYGYTGTYVVSRKFKIHELSDFDYEVRDATSGTINNVVYGKSQKPNVGAMFMKKDAELFINSVKLADPSSSYHLYRDTDYKIKYKNNKKAGETACAEIIGINKYKGQKFEIPYTVLAGNFNKLRMIAPDVIYSTKAKAWISAPVLMYEDGSKLKLKAGTDYKVLTEDDYDYEGKADGKLPEPGTQVSVTVTGLGNYAGYSRILTYKVIDAKYDISKANFKIADAPYLRYNQRIPEAKDFTTALAADKTTQLTLGEDFEIYSMTSCYDRGTVKVTLRGINNYAGMKVVTFKIVKRNL